MSFQNIDEISEALGAERVRVRDLYSAWEQRQPVGDPEKRKLSGKTSAKQIDWVQSDLPPLGRKLRADLFLELGNILREESHYATARAARIQTAEQALTFYQRALELDPDRLEALVLTAAAAFVIAEPGSALRQQAQEKARRIIEITKKLEDEEGPRKECTRAQATANAVLGDVDAATAHYGRLKEINSIKTADLADARFYSQFL